MNPTPTPTPVDPRLERIARIEAELQTLLEEENLSNQAALTPSTVPSPQPVSTPVPQSQDDIPLSIPPLRNDPLSVSGFLNNFATGTWNAISGAGRFLADLPGEYVEHAKKPFLPITSTIPFGLGPVVDMTAEAVAKDPKGAAMMAGKTGAFLAGESLNTVAPGLGLLAGPVFSKGFDMLTGSLGLTPPESPEETIAGFEQELGSVIGPLGVMKGTGKVLNKVRNVGRRLWPDSQALKWVEGSRVGAIATAHGAGNNLRPQEWPLLQEAIAGEDTWLRQSGRLLNGTDPTIINKPYARLPEWDKQWAIYQKNLDDLLQEAAQNKISTLQEIDQGLAQKLAKGQPVPPRTTVGGQPVGLKGTVDISDLNLNAVLNEAANMESVAATRGIADSIFDTIQAIEGDFVKYMTDPATGARVAVPKQLTLTEANNYLQQLYGTLRRAKVFDAAYEAKAVNNPSVMAANEGLINTLSTITDALRKRIRDAALEGAIILRRPTLKQRASQLAEWDQIYHDLQPYKILSNRMSTEIGNAVAVAKGTLNPASLKVATGSSNTLGGFTSNAAAVPRAQMLNSLYQAIARNKGLEAALLKGPRTIADLWDIREIKAGMVEPPVPKNFNPISWDSPEATIAGASSWMLSAPDMIAQRADAVPMISRDVNLLGTQLPKILPLFLPPGNPELGIPDQSQQIQSQIQNALAAGNVKQLSLLLGQLKRQYPMLPLQPGITGLPSEITVDGRQYIFDPQDVSEYSDMIGRMNLDAKEKGRRKEMLLKYNLVTPPHVKVTTTPPGQDALTNPNSKLFQFDIRIPGRVNGSFANRKL